jgi:high affinity Mn2+ porin
MSLRSTLSAKLLAGISALWLTLYPLFAYGVSSVEADPEVDNEKAIPDDTSWYSLHGQATYVLQYKNKFNSPYAGDKSLLSTGDVGKSYTVTVTPFMGVRLWQGAEVFYNPEAAEGVPFSNLSGLGGFTNGEMQRGNLVPMQFYNARAFIRQTIGLGGGVEHIEDGPNQIKGNVDKRRVTLTYGWVSALDYFDSNRYSHDPRTQFLNWSIMAAGAYDFAANGRGYTYGVVGEYFDEGWTLRLARLAMPKSPNGMSLDYQLTQQYGDTVEVEHEHKLLGQDGAVRLLLFQNRGIMAKFSDAVNQAQQGGYSPPNILTSRTGYQQKWGYVINAEQAMFDDVGVFARWSWNNGQSETEAFTDISRSLSAGTSIKGSFWRRPDDTYGLAFSFNGISSSQINYLSQGGSTMFIGDGKIAYQGERILETYYSVNLFKGAYLSADYQYIQNPAYNSNRGPVSFFGLRAHFEL